MTRDSIPQTIRSSIEPIVHTAAAFAKSVAAKAASTLQPVGERLGAWSRAVGLDRLLEHPRVAEGRQWAQAFGFGNRPVQIVGAAVVVGVLYLAASDPFVTPVPESSEEVAARIAPVGTVSLGPSPQSRVADRSDPDSAAAASIN
jgi:hypothetical protein